MKWIVSSLTLLIFLGFTVPAMAKDCQLSSGFGLVKAPSEWDITYRGVVVTRIGAHELNDIFGGGKYVPPPTTCNGQISTTEMFGFVVGREDDLFLAYGIIRDQRNGLAVGLQKLTFYAHDYNISVNTILPNQFLLTFGWKRDLNARLCWNYRNDYYWWHNANIRAGFGGCVSKNWPWSYPSQEQRIEFPAGLARSK